MTARTPHQKEKQREKTAKRKAEKRELQDAFKVERSIAERFQLPGLKPPCDARASVTEKMIRAALFPAHVESRSMVSRYSPKFYVKTAV